VSDNYANAVGHLVAVAFTQGIWVAKSAGISVITTAERLIFAINLSVLGLTAKKPGQVKGFTRGNKLMRFPWVKRHSRCRKEAGKFVGKEVRIGSARSVAGAGSGYQLRT
jgi:hypothetical protein